MTKNFKWEVSPAPTGRYRSFKHRVWPIGFLKANERHRVLISCDDEYIPSKVKTGDHKELTVRIDVWNNVYKTYKLETFKHKFNTLQEVKDKVEDFYTRNEHLFNTKGE